MLCKHKTTIFPRNGMSNDDGYMVAIYTPQEKIILPDGERVSEVKVVGHMLPEAHGVVFDINGRWESHKKNGTQYVMESYEEVIQHTKEGIISYLASGLIKGIGRSYAERIYAKFGNETLNILDKEPGRLLEISGISAKKLEAIKDSYLAYRSARDIVALLTPYQVSAALAVKIFEKYGAAAIRIVSEHPYKLCEIQGIGFTTADKIACNMGLNPRSVERIAAGLMYTLQKAETDKGHLCLKKAELIKAAQVLLKTNEAELSDVEIMTGIAELIDRSMLVQYQDHYYRWFTERAERQVSEKLLKLLGNGKRVYSADLDQEIRKEEMQCGIKLEKEQKNAIKTSLLYPVSIITGGPGTGKTLSATRSS